MINSCTFISLLDKIYYENVIHFYNVWLDIILLGGLATSRLPGYSIRVSNTTTLSTASICYQDPGHSSLPDVLEKECHMTGQFVWLYQNRTLDGPCPMLEICEVQIFGKF